MKKERLPQTTEPPTIAWEVTEYEALDDLKLKTWEEGYMKYRVFGDCLEMRSIYVLLKYREQGNGTKFFKWLEDEVRSTGKKYVWVHATTDGKTDILGVFLKKLKYKNKEVGTDNDKFIWRKDIK